MDDAQPNLFDSAKAVLEANDRGQFTIPAGGLYSHQWLWDSCFIAIGIRHYDIDRAKVEILSLLRGQWSNGMLPHMIFASGDQNRRDRNIWRSWLSPFAPDEVATSGITQPPMLAEAIVQIGNRLKKAERRTWYQTVYPALLNYHQWLYSERDPHDEGLALQIHPYETGLDNTPPWISELHQHHRPWWVSLVQKTGLDNLVTLFRRDTHKVPAGQRISNIDALLYYRVIRRLRRKQYDSDAILTHSLFAVEDLTFNCILIRANRYLLEIAKTIRREVPAELVERMKLTENALDQLWDAYSGQYYSRNFVTHKFIKEPSIATLMPLYAGCITKERAEQLVSLLERKDMFGPAYPVPTVPIDSNWFNPVGYWQGSTWINTNWLIIQGLRSMGFDDHAAALTDSTLELVQNGGCYEYFNPETGQAAGAPDFSWTAALTLDLLNR